MLHGLMIRALALTAGWGLLIALMLLWGQGDEAPQLSFLSDRANFQRRGVYLLDTRTDVVARLTPHDTRAWDYDWSPDGEQIVFTRICENEVPNTRCPYLMDAYGGDVRPLPTVPSTQITTLDWSPTGPYIGLQYNDNSGLPDAYVYDLTGDSLIELTPGDALRGIDLAWSPDGSQVAFAAVANGNYDIFTTRLNPIRPVVLEDSLGRDRFPAWSPDGRQVAFLSDRDGPEKPYIRDLKADTARAAPAPDALITSSFLDWSPDGETLLFQTQRTDPRSGGPLNEIWLYRPADDALTTLDSARPFDLFPQFTPDGRAITVLSRPANSSQPDIFLIDLTTGQRRNLSQHPAYDWLPRWRPGS